MKFGAHMPTTGGVWKALERGAVLECEIVQVFVKNNMQWLGKPFSPSDVSAYLEASKRFPFDCVFAHAGYLINLGARPSPNRDKSIQSLVQEIELCGAIGLPFVVLHPGAHLGAGEEEGLRQIVEGLDEVIAATRKSTVRIALENTAGQGSCLGNRMAHLGEIIGRVRKPERVAVCLDTAHFFAAGYDIRTRNGWEAAIAEVETHVGLDRIAAFHLNDSKTDLGSRVDRHEHIGKGKIGKAAFGHIVNDPRFRDHPGCLETPKSKDLHEDAENLAVLKALRG